MIYIKTVDSLAEIKNNMKVLDNYLVSRNEDEVSWAKERIKQGTCFIVVSLEDEFHFYPSRFIGYVNNTMSKHDSNEWKDGRETNSAISNILALKPESNDKLECQYKDYCELLGFKANKSGAFGVKRKYWLLSE
ncbi:MAG: hypothetical protein K2J32_11030 [Ruminococcus sp.]|nr:hypothetical protein [Ruminococcus sp.]